jgi:hypothetical protein
MTNLEKDDMIGRLIREEGLLKAPPDLTGKIMQQIEKTAVRPVMEYQPLLNRKAWIAIAATMLALVGFSAWYLMFRNQPVTSYTDYFKPAADFIGTLHFSLPLTPQLLMIGSIVFGSTGFLLVMDYYLNRKLMRA